MTIEVVTTNEKTLIGEAHATLEVYEDKQLIKKFLAKVVKEPGADAGLYDVVHLEEVKIPEIKMAGEAKQKKSGWKPNARFHLDVPLKRGRSR